MIRTGSPDIKMQFEQLLSGETLTCQIDEEIVYNQLDTNENAVWSLLLASGYLNTMEKHGNQYPLTLTNYEVKQMFETLVQDWFGMDAGNYNRFIKAPLLLGDLDAMNDYMSEIALSMFSFFDDGMILEFKVHNPRREPSLQETVESALAQIEEKHYEQTLLDHGIKRENIRKYGFAFEGKKVLIG